MNLGEWEKIHKEWIKAEEYRMGLEATARREAAEFSKFLQDHPDWVEALNAPTV